MTTANSKRKLPAKVFIALTILVTVAVGTAIHLVEDYDGSRYADIQEMEDNNGECVTYGCTMRSHDHGYETPKQAAWYAEHIHHSKE